MRHLPQFAKNPGTSGSDYKKEPMPGSKNDVGAGKNPALDDEEHPATPGVPDPGEQHTG